MRQIDLLHAPTARGGPQGDAKRVDLKPVFISHPVFRAPAWGALHPLATGRQGAVLDLCSRLGWRPDEFSRTCEMASEAQLTAFHDAAYVTALREACTRGRVSAEERERFNFGTMENPIFPGLFERAAATVGGAIAAAEAALEGRCAFHPAGGTHHGRRDQANGFCYFNDPVFAVRTLLGAGAAPVLYLDLDAHHGDGVEAAFAGDARVFMISVHEAGRWPHSGALDDRAGGNARNIPVPRGMNDCELEFLIDGPIAALAERIQPKSIVIVAGADCLAGDPLSSMALSNGALWGAVERACALAPVQVVLGGGGYNPWTTARAWAGLWGRLAGFEIPQRLPDRASAALAELSCDLIDNEDIDPRWLTTLVDPPNRSDVRGEIRAAARAVLAL